MVFTSNDSTICINSNVAMWITLIDILLDDDAISLIFQQTSLNVLRSIVLVSPPKTCQSINWMSQDDFP